MLKSFFQIQHPAKPMALKDYYSPRNLSIAGLIAAVYVALTLINPLSYGEVQFRISEALTVLPILFPQAIPGLFIGVIISNLFSPVGFLDVIFGSLATLLAAIGTYKLRNKPVLAMLSPVLVNGIIIGLLLHFLLQAPLFATILSVGFGELVVVALLGTLLLKSLDSMQLDKR